MTPIVVFKKELTYPPPPYSLSPATGEAEWGGEGKRTNGRGGEEWRGEQSKHNIKRLIKNKLWAFNKKFYFLPKEDMKKSLQTHMSIYVEINTSFR